MKNNVLTFFPLTGGCSEGLDAFRFFFEQLNERPRLQCYCGLQYQPRLLNCSNNIIGFNIICCCCCCYCCVVFTLKKRPDLCSVQYLLASVLGPTDANERLRSVVTG